MNIQIDGPTLVLRIPALTCKSHILPRSFEAQLLVTREFFASFELSALSSSLFAEAQPVLGGSPSSC